MIFLSRVLGVFFLSLVFVMIGHHNARAAAPRCSAKKMAEILAPSTAQKKWVNVGCSVKLNKGDVVSKIVQILGAKGSGVNFNCNGALLDGQKGNVYVGKVLLIVRSAWKHGQGWKRPKNVVIKNCRINGAVLIYGMDKNGEGKNVRKSSHRLGHTKRVQAAAPTNITLDNLSITAQSRIPVYVSPGVTRVTLKNSVIKGYSSSVAVYLDAESEFNRIINNRFNIKTKKRELIAIDGSARNVISRNLFSKLTHGGIYIYRNCGEGGTVRHQAPQYNKIVGNGFYYRKFRGYKYSLKKLGKKSYVPAVWIGSRNGHRRYCNADQGYRFGSSINNGDLATQNTVANNQIVKLNPVKMFRSFNADNVISGNKRVRKIRFGKAQSKPKPVQPDPVSQNQNSDLSFSCSTKNNNYGCQKFINCPVGQSVVTVKAACNLESGRVQKSQLGQVGWNSLRVVRPSDHIRQGVCSIGEIDISQGQADLSFLRNYKRFYIACKEYDKNGGDCEIRGRAVCR